MSKKQCKGKIILVERFTPELLKAAVDENKVYIFGDNVARIGRGGQAKICRHQPNTIGVVTKHYPSMSERAFFSDQPGEYIWVMNDLQVVLHYFRRGKTIVWPSAGIGTGRAELSKRSPQILALINEVKTYMLYYNEAD